MRTDFVAGLYDNSLPRYVAPLCLLFGLTVGVNTGLFCGLAVGVDTAIKRLIFLGSSLLLRKSINGWNGEK